MNDQTVLIIAGLGTVLWSSVALAVHVMYRYPKYTVVCAITLLTTQLAVGGPCVMWANASWPASLGTRPSEALPHWVRFALALGYVAAIALNLGLTPCLLTLEVYERMPQRRSSIFGTAVRRLRYSRHFSLGMRVLVTAAAVAIIPLVFVAFWLGTWWFGIRIDLPDVVLSLGIGLWFATVVLNFGYSMILLGKVVSEIWNERQAARQEAAAHHVPDIDL